MNAPLWCGLVVVVSTKAETVVMAAGSKARSGLGGGSETAAAVVSGWVAGNRDNPLETKYVL